MSGPSTLTYSGARLSGGDAAGGARQQFHAMPGLQRPHGVAQGGRRHAQPGSSAGEIPLIGARRLDLLEDNLKAAEVELTEVELDALDQVSALPAQYPGWMFAVQAVRANLLAKAGQRTMR
jgi:hypothetical protein